MTMDLRNAVIHGNIDRVRELIEAGENINAKDRRGNSLLHWAAFKGHVEIMKLLMASGAVNAMDKHGSLRLRWAAHSGNTDAVNLLFESEGADNDINNLYLAFHEIEGKIIELNMDEEEAQRLLLLVGEIIQIIEKNRGI
jgi:ankyrin repeat protein